MPGERRASFEFPPIDKERAYDIVDAMQPIAESHDASVAQIAIAWLLHQPAVTSVIIGAKRLDQLDDNLAAVDVTLSDDELGRLDDVSRLHVEYPDWMHMLPPDRRPGQSRDWGAVTRK